MFPFWFHSSLRADAEDVRPTKFPRDTSGINIREDLDNGLIDNMIGRQRLSTEACSMLEH